MSKKIEIHEAELEEKFIVGSGPGGQNLQKTASCVWLKHIPTGIEVKCQKSRSREENRRLARRMLVAILDQMVKDKEQEEKALRAKRRREKRVRSKTQKAKLVQEKRLISRKKSLRKTPESD